jgi:Ca2+-binding RTX toxin-like protein
MRRTILLLATMALTLLVASGVALSVTKIGTDSPDVLWGTRGADQLLGKGGSDEIIGRAGQDVILGGPGRDALVDGPFREGAVDTLEGGAGNDFLHAENRPAARDIVSCGAGRDLAFVDRKDIVSDDCERIREID